nr:hypothetical protein [Micromonospora sp. DSM 115978]
MISRTQRWRSLPQLHRGPSGLLRWGAGPAAGAVGGADSMDIS